MRYTLDDYFDGKMKNDDNFIFLGKVPNVLKRCGFNERYKMAITKKVLDKIIDTHNISKNNILQLYNSIEIPVFVSKSYGNTFTATINNNDEGKEKEYILVSFVIDKKISNIYVNEITSMYDRQYLDNFFYKEEKNIICFHRKKIKDFYLNSNRLQMNVPKEDSVSFIYDDNIANEY